MPCGDVCAKVHTCAEPQAAVHLRGSGHAGWAGKVITQITLRNTCPHEGNPDSPVSSDLKKLSVWASHGHFRLHSTGSNWIFLPVCSSASGCAELTGPADQAGGLGAFRGLLPGSLVHTFCPAPHPLLFPLPPAGPHPPHGLRCVCCSRCPPCPPLGHCCGPPWPLLPEGLCCHAHSSQATARESAHPRPPVRAPQPPTQVPTDSPFAHRCPQHLPQALRLSGSPQS